MRTELLAGLVLLGLAGLSASPALARNSDRQSGYHSSYPSCATQGCIRFHESGRQRSPRVSEGRWTRARSPRSH